MSDEAARELLEALEGMIHSFGHLGYYPGQNAAIKAADAAIAKARDQTPMTETEQIAECMRDRR